MVSWYVEINWLTNFIAFFIGLFLYKRFPREIKTVFYFVAFGVFTTVYYKFHSYFITKNAMPIGHFYFPIAISIAGIFYSQILNDFIKPAIVKWIVIVYVIYCIINTVFVQGLFQYPSLTGSTGALILSLFSVAYFVKVMAEAKIEKLSAEPLIWINSGFLVYYTVGFFYHSLYNLIVKASLEVALFAIDFFSILNLLFYLIIAVGFLLAGKVIKT